MPAPTFSDFINRVIANDTEGFKACLDAAVAEGDISGLGHPGRRQNQVIHRLAQDADRHEDKLRYLLQVTDYPVDAVNLNGQTALMQVSLNKEDVRSVVHLLLDKGADATRKDRGGLTAYHYALTSFKPGLEVAEDGRLKGKQSLPALLSHPSFKATDLDIKDKQGNSLYQALKDLSDNAGGQLITDYVLTLDTAVAAVADKITIIPKKRW